MWGGLRGLVIVLGTLSVAASAGASTLLYASLWDDGAAPLRPRPVLVDEIIEDYAGPVNGPLGAPAPSYEPGSIGSGPPTTRLMPGAPRFGRRDFIWAPMPLTPRPLPPLPLGPLLYHPLAPFPPGPVTDFGGIDWSDWLPWPIEDLCPELLLRLDFLEELWPILDGSVTVPDFPGPLLPPWDPVDDWGVILTMVDGDEPIELDAAVLESNSFEATGAGADPTGASFAVTAIPEPATGALLFAGLCVLAARRRRC